ncbi:hypothetical protein E05_51970 (plasmid) [Plautia stali symbiont]|nr:hypothetical protein E05_51970 [Plautia stali symbiont]
MCVHKNHRKKGFGREIVTTSVRQAIKQYRPDNMNTRLTVRAYNTSVEMISLLKNVGFRQKDGVDDSVILFKEYRT